MAPLEVGQECGPAGVRRVLPSGEDLGRADATSGPILCCGPRSHGGNGLVIQNGLGVVLPCGSLATHIKYLYRVEGLKFLL